MWLGILFCSMHGGLSAVCFLLPSFQLVVVAPVLLCFVFISRYVRDDVDGFGEQLLQVEANLTHAVGDVKVNILYCLFFLVSMRNRSVLRCRCCCHCHCRLLVVGKLTLSHTCLNTGACEVAACCWGRGRRQCCANDSQTGGRDG